jgi:hypothetical protein
MKLSYRHLVQEKQLHLSPVKENKKRKIRFRTVGAAV